MDGGVPVVRDVSRFAECASVFNGDDEIISQQSIHGCDIASVISRVPFGLESKDYGRPGVGLVCVTANSEVQTASNAMTGSEILIFMSVGILSCPISIRNNRYALIPFTTL